jgi:hypothetical protein
MQLARFAYLAVAIALLGAACSNDEDKGPQGPTLEELSPEITEAVCGEFEACVGSKLVDVALGGFECDENLLAQLQDDGFAQLEAAVEAKRVKYNAGKVGECIEGIGKLGCGVTTQRLVDIAGCDQVFVGTVDVGDDCDVDEACTGDAYCKREDSCPGTCTERGGKDDECTEDDACKSGLTCGADKCVAPGDEGDACGTASSGACDFGLLCSGADQATSKPGTCKKLADVFAGAAGEACSLEKTDFCDPGLSCIVKIENLQPKASCAKQVDAGADCNFGVPSQCPKGEYCDIAMGKIAGKCEQLPGEGDACLALAGSLQCAPGLTCGSDSKCRTLGRIGDACGDDTDCASSLCEDDKCATDFCEP